MKTEFSYQIGDEIKTVTVTRDGERFLVAMEGKVYSVAVRQPEEGRLVLEVDGRRLGAYVVRHGSRRYVAIAGDTWAIKQTHPQRQRKRAGAGGGAGSGSLEATMPGLVLDVLVSAGDEVARGDTLVLLEAMKMELRLTAPFAGRIRRVNCAAGQVVERRQVLVEVEEKLLIQ